jgi:hypothetical protein
VTTPTQPSPSDAATTEPEPGSREWGAGLARALNAHFAAPAPSPRPEGNAEPEGDLCVCGFDRSLHRACAKPGDPYLVASIEVGMDPHPFTPVPAPPPAPTRDGTTLTEERLSALSSLYAPISHEEVLALVAELRRLRAVQPEAPGTREARALTGIREVADLGLRAAHPDDLNGRAALKTIRDEAARALSAPPRAETGREERPRIPGPLPLSAVEESRGPWCDGCRFLVAGPACNEADWAGPIEDTKKPRCAGVARLPGPPAASPTTESTEGADHE